MNDTEIILKTIDEINNKKIILKNIEYGNDSTGTPAVWMHFYINIKINKSNKKK